MRRGTLDGVATMRARPATEAEAERYVRFAEEAAEVPGDLLLAFHVELDGARPLR